MCACQDVFIPMEKIIGGQDRCGFGWNMLMDCLSEGRSVSLPASAVGAAKLAVTAVGAYARIRKQFKVTTSPGPQTRPCFLPVFK